MSREALRHALDVEVAFRAYPANQQANAPAPEATPKLHAVLDTLIAMTDDNPTQHASAVQLQQTVDAWQQTYAITPTAAGASAPPAGDRGVAGQALFDQVRSRATQFTLAEDSLYTERLERHKRHHWISTASVVLEVVIALLGLTWFVRQILRNAREIEEHHEELARQAATLEEQASELEEQAAELEMSN
ncbi:MAG TPA: CHASE3 domain-containing protein, partial [Polyangiaceae bacterium]